jgi:hypothetical protein
VEIGFMVIGEDIEVLSFMKVGEQQLQQLEL